MGELTTELNRLAGTTGLTDVAAANAWAGTTGRELVGALNAKAGTTGLGLLGALNLIAGTTGLATNGALTGHAGVAPFTPTDITGLQVWLKADALSLADNDPVSSWTDSSGLNRHGTAAGTTRPLFKTNVLNGKPVLRFDDVDDEMVAGGFTLAQPLTAFVTFKVDQTGAWAALGDPTLYGDSLGGSTLYAGSLMPIGSGITQSTWYTFALRISGAGSKANRSNVSTTYTGNPGTTGWTAATMVGGAGGRYGSDVAELIVYNSFLSGAQIDQVGGYLATKYGVTWAGGAT